MQNTVFATVNGSVTEKSKTKNEENVTARELPFQKLSIYIFIL